MPTRIAHPVIAPHISRSSRINRAGVFSRRALARFAFVALTMIVAPRIHAQDTFRLFLSVTAATGEPITDLKPSEVVLRQGDSHCVDPTIAPIDWPTRLTVLVDNGVQMFDALGELRSSLRAFFGHLPDGIELGVVTMAPQPRWLVRPTSSREALLKNIDLLTPDRATPKFFDSLMEAADRISKDKVDNFPMILAIVSDLSEGSNAKEQELMRMLDRFASHPATVDIIMLSADSSRKAQTLSGAAAAEIAILVAKDTGGSYEAINSSSRLVSLLPDLARRITERYVRQSHQYRIGCARWDGPISSARPFSLGAARPGAASAASSTDGHLP